jgi:carbon-monoxide dehydrogenase large subunit
MRAGPGSAVRRNEDGPLLRGAARYLPDLRFGQLHAAFVRSTVASARIRSVETAAALVAPGVVAVATAADLGLGHIRGHLSGALSSVFNRPPLADGVVRMVGEAIAVVVAETLSAAVDAAELVEVIYDALPVVVDPEDALAEDCFVLFPEHGSNRALEMSVPGEGDALAGAEVIVKGRFVNQRVSAAPMETNGALALPGDDTHAITVWASTQRVHQLRDELALVLGLDPSEVRVLTPQVGGGFGSKYDAAPEAAVVAAMALRLQRPVVWYETRTESMVSLFHGRGQVQYVELGLRGDGQFVGIRVKLIGDAGAYPMIGALIPSATLRMLPGPYGIASVEASAVAAATNTTPMGAYRGAGRPEACALLERIIDVAAVELGIDPVELRRRNLLSAEAFPFTTATGMVYDVGEYRQTLDAAVALIGYEQVRAAQAERRSRGAVKQLGVGVVMWLDATPLNRPGEYAAVDISVLPGGGIDVAVRAGTMDQGQGHATTWGLILSGILGVPVESVRLVRSDTATVPKGEGTGSARSLQVTGSSVNRAGHQVLAQARAVAAHLLEAAAEDIVVTDTGELAVTGTPSRSVSWAEVAAAAACVERALPPQVAALLGANGLGAESDEDNEGPTFPSGTHAAIVEVDTETGAVEVLHFVAVDDCGRVVNPVTFAGQQHGGIVQGMAQALYEGIAYDAEGNPLTATFADYGIPSAADVPSLDVHTIETPTSRNPLGAKGIGQGGAVGSTPAVQNAVIDALSHLGVRHIDMPLTAERVWRAIASTTERTF